MNNYTPGRKRTKVRPFDAVHGMSEVDIRQMFLSVSVKSLAEWLKYYIAKDKPEVCQIIREVSLYRV